MRLITLALIASVALAGCTHHRGRQGTPAAAKAPPAPPLPGGLVGDGQQHSYAEPSPRPS